MAFMLMALFITKLAASFARLVSSPQKYLPHDDTTVLQSMLKWAEHESVQTEALMKVIGYFEQNDEEQATMNE